MADEKPKKSIFLHIQRGNMAKVETAVVDVITVVIEVFAIDVRAVMVMIVIVDVV